MIVYDVPENASVALLDGLDSCAKVSNLDPIVWIEEITKLVNRNIHKGDLVGKDFLEWGAVCQEYFDFLNAIHIDNHK